MAFAEVAKADGRRLSSGLLSRTCLTCLADLKAVRMALRQLAPIGLGDVIERDAECIRRDGEAPEHVTQLFDEALGAGDTLLENSLSHEAEDFARLLGQPGRGVEKSLVRSEDRVGGAKGRVLIIVESH